mmetsp:Transcript_9565/g.28908  ORF Transcript_9565/g.28908 Transcript_9565/m.28908 type:complete len:252 (-) Transcript_9565:1381-2136(-)
MEHRYTYAAIGSGSGAAGFFLTTFLTAFLGAATAPDASPTTPVILAFGSSIATTAAAGSVLSGAAEAGNFFLVFFFGAAATGASLEVVTPTGVTPATTSFDAVSSGACGRTGCFFVTFLTGFFTSPRASVPVVGFFGTLLTGFTASSTAEGASAVCGTSAAGGASATMSLVVAAWSGAGASVFGTWTVVSEGSFFCSRVLVVLLLEPRKQVGDATSFRLLSNGRLFLDCGGSLSCLWLKLVDEFRWCGHCG